MLSWTRIGTRGGPALLFLTVTALWGIPYLLIAVALDDGVSPLSIVSIRVILGAAVLLSFTGTQALGVFRSAPIRLTTLALVEVAIPFTLIAWGEQTVTSATTGVLIATEPAFVLFAGCLLGQRSRPPVVLVGGIAVGFVGVLMLLGAPGSGRGAGLILGAAACYALGAVLVESWFPETPRLPLVAAMLSIAALPVTILAVLTDSLSAVSGSTVIALLVLGVACTAGGFGAFFALIRSAGAASASVITYTAPLVALTLGATIRHEPLTWTTAAGTALILGGAWLTLRTGQTKSAHEEFEAIEGRRLSDRSSGPWSVTHEVCE